MPSLFGSTANHRISESKEGDVNVLHLLPPLSFYISLTGRALYTLLCYFGSIRTPSFDSACHRYLYCTIDQRIAWCVSLIYL